jgi:hypothetical protein
VYDSINKLVKISANGEDLWSAVKWDAFDGRVIYRSASWWTEIP